MPGSFASSSPDTSRTLLARVRDRDPLAWERFVRIYGPLIYRWCRQNGLQSSDAADVTQNVFSGLHANLNRFEDRPEGGSFGGWLRVVTRNRIADFYRTRGVQLPLDEQQASQYHNRQPDDSAIDETDRQYLIQRTLASLQVEFETSTWDMFWRVTVLQDKPKDVAADCSVSVAAVYQAKSRVLRRVRQELSWLMADE